MIVFEERNAILETAEIEANSLFEKGAFSTKNGEIEANSLFEKEAFSTKNGEIESFSAVWAGAATEVKPAVAWRILTNVLSVKKIV